MLTAEADARARGASPVGRIIVGELGMEITVVSRHSAAGHHRVFPELLSGQHDQARERGLRTLAAIQYAATEAAEPHLDEIRRGLPDLHSPEHADDALTGRHRLDPRRSSSE